MLGSALCALVEAAVYSVSRSRIETLRRQGDRRGEALARIREHIDEPIAALLTLDTVIDIAGSAFVGALVAEHYDDWVLGAFSGVFTAVMLLFGELVPKSLGFKYANQLAPLFAGPLRFLTLLLWPVVRLTGSVTRLFVRDARIAAPTEEDIISLAHLSEKGGAIHSHEARWIANALNLDKLTAKEVMTPAKAVRRVSEEMPLSMTRPDAEHWRFSRLPVTKDDDPDQVVGVVQRREVFNCVVEGKLDFKMAHLMALPVFVPETMRAHELLTQFIKRRIHLFCVQDAAGKFVGIVTLEDVLEALLGTEIVGEQDLFEDMQKAHQVEEGRRLGADLGRAGGVLEQVVIGHDSPLRGRAIKDCHLPHEVILGSILRKGQAVVPHGDLVLEEGDQVSLIGRKEDVEAVRRKLHPDVH